MEFECQQNNRRGYFFLQRTGFLWLSILVSHSPLFSQKTSQQNDKGKQTIQIRHANTLSRDKSIANGAERLIGNVSLEDDSVLMDCDSAWIFSDNSFLAFSKVHLNRRDTMDLYGDSLHYNGNTKQAEMFGKITYIQKKTTLTTSHLIYDVNLSTVHYWDGGTLVDSSNTLTSMLGTYRMKEKLACFKEQVKLVNPDYVVTCDTMNYSPPLQTSYFLGPTHIKGKANSMYCESGYYNSFSGISQFSQHASITGKKGEKLSGDQIFYDKTNDIGQALDRVSLQDSADNITITGEYAFYNGNAKSILVTCRALMLQQYDKDTLHLHADTLIGQNITLGDTNKGKTKAPKLLLAFHHVLFFKKDLQGKCDSLTYDEKDSLMTMMYSPVLWSDANQLTADTMKLHMKNKEMNMMDMRSNAFIASRDTAAAPGDTVQFNQIKGRNMKAFFANNKIQKVKVMGNAQTIYYVYSDNNKEMVGANRADCSNMLIFINANRIKSITFLDKPDATLYPQKDIKPSDFLLKNFRWRGKEKPQSVNDIFGDSPY